MSCRHAKKGMTVIELVVVVALVGIMAGVVAPSIASLDDRSSELPPSELVKVVVRRARTTAIERAVCVEVTIDPASGRFWLDPPVSSGVIPLPEGATLVSRANRVHIHIEPTGEAYIDAELSVRHGDTTTSVAVTP